MLLCQSPGGSKVLVYLNMQHPQILNVSPTDTQSHSLQVHVIKQMLMSSRAVCSAFKAQFFERTSSSNLSNALGSFQTTNESASFITHH